jgi:ribosomal protein L44E
MANRQLSADELRNLFAPLLEDTRKRLQNLSNGDATLLWALRRKLYKELTYDERSKPMQRRKLKNEKRAEQDNKCALCGDSLPVTYAVLDRIHAMEGYTRENTRLICAKCDIGVQRERRYK